MGVLAPSPYINDKGELGDEELGTFNLIIAKYDLQRSECGIQIIPCVAVYSAHPTFKPLHFT